MEYQISYSEKFIQKIISLADLRKYWNIIFEMKCYGVRNLNGSGKTGTLIESEAVKLLQVDVNALTLEDSDALIENLTAIIKDCRISYYRKNKPLVSDDIYDRLVEMQSNLLL